MKRTWWQRFKGSTAYTQANIVCTFVIMVATIAYALIAEWQLGAMKGQLKQMIGSSAQTDRMLCLYQQQLSKMDASIQQASRLATATETANQNILEADRPWLGATLLLDQDIAVGSSPTASISFINSGKRPARVILMGARPRLFVVFPKDPPYERGPLQRSSASFLVPGAQLGMKLRLVINGDGKITDEMVNRIKGPESLFIYAKVDYLDMRDNTVHHTHACWKYVTYSGKGATPDAFYNCLVSDGYNDAD